MNLQEKLKRYLEALEKMERSKPLGVLNDWAASNEFTSISNTVWKLKVSNASFSAEVNMYWRTDFTDEELVFNYILIEAEIPNKRGHPDKLIKVVEPFKFGWDAESASEIMISGVEDTIRAMFDILAHP